MLSHLFVICFLSRVLPVFSFMVCNIFAHPALVKDVVGLFPLSTSSTHALINFLNVISSHLNFDLTLLGGVSKQTTFGWFSFIF
ncbi:hypothetical protein HanPSC8_Chr10g0413681 [Helianthus annuus]|nr:hypothetical protein HanPSC8_Chr10g0413681 [Helianthus annuus]